MTLRPQQLGDVLDATFRTFRFNPATTMMLPLLVSLAVFVVTSPFVWINARMFNLETGELPAGGDIATSLRAFGSLFAAFALPSIAISLVMPLVLYAVHGGVLGRRVSPGAAWAAAKGRILPTVGLSVVNTLVVLAGLAVLGGIFVGLGAMGLTGEPLVILLIVVMSIAGLCAALWWTVKVVLAPTCLVLEGTGIFGSLKRSFQLTRGGFWRVVGTVVACNMLASLVLQILAGGVQLVVSAAAAAVVSDPSAQSGVEVLATALVSAVTSSMLAAFGGAVACIIYVDRRIRSEAYDVELLRLAADRG